MVRRTKGCGTKWCQLVACECSLVSLSNFPSMTSNCSPSSAHTTMVLPSRSLLLKHVYVMCPAASTKKRISLVALKIVFFCRLPSKQPSEWSAGTRKHKNEKHRMTYSTEQNDWNWIQYRTEELNMSHHFWRHFVPHPFVRRTILSRTQNAPNPLIFYPNKFNRCCELQDAVRRKVRRVWGHFWTF